MSDRERLFESNALKRLRSAAVMSDYQMERAARDTAGKGGSHILLKDFPDLKEMLPWVRRAA